MATGLLYLRSKMPRPKPIQISIPNPCTEDWNKMTPAEQGRFCSSCRKCVMDFTTFSDKQLYEYMLAHKEQKTCGRFLDTQLNHPIHIPPQPHSRLYRYFIGLGLTLILAQIPIEEAKAKAPYTYASIISSNSLQEENTSEDSITIKGRVLDENKEPLYGAIVQIYQDTLAVAGTITDNNGEYSLTVRQNGITNLLLSVKCASYKPQKISVASNTNSIKNFKLAPNATLGLPIIEIQNYKVPLLDEGNRRVITSDEIEKMAH